MFVNTLSTMVFVAFLNSTEFQFSNEARLATTCPSNTALTAFEVEPADLCKITVSKRFSLPSGLSRSLSPSNGVVEELKSEKN